MTGHAVKPRMGMDPCRPSCPHGDCANCVRFDLAGLPDDPERRPGTVVVDPSAIVRDGRCGLFVPIVGAPTKPDSVIFRAKRQVGGLRTDGVRTVADLMARCRVDHDTGCWHWAGCVAGNGRASLWLPAVRRRVTLGVAICVLRTGEVPPAGQVWHCIRSCPTPDCANPAHRRAGDRSSQMLAAKLQRDAATRARIAAGKRAASRLSDEAAAAIQASDEPLHVVAARHSISISHASQIRRGEQRRPLGARGASVFNLGAAA